VLHHDLKSANVLLFHSDAGAAPPPAGLDAACLPHVCAKLCDFGLATGVTSAAHGASALQSTRTGGARAGTLAYTAPEAFSDEYVPASEVYAFAVVLWVLLPGGVPWAAPPVGLPLSLASLVLAVCAGERPALPSPLNKGVLGSLAQRCWTPSAPARPS
jgi:Serine/threonine protein kinase